MYGFAFHLFTFKFKFYNVTFLQRGCISLQIRLTPYTSSNSNSLKMDSCYQSHCETSLRTHSKEVLWKLVPWDLTSSYSVVNQGIKRSSIRYFRLFKGKQSQMLFRYIINVELFCRKMDIKDSIVQLLMSIVIMLIKKRYLLQNYIVT